MTITEEIRSLLPRFGGYALVPEHYLSERVRDVLRSRNLANDHFADGYWQATPRAEGYIADPRSFDA